MKQRANWLMASVVTLLALGIFIVALIRSAHYTAPAGTNVTVAQLQKRLATPTNIKPTPPKPAQSPKPQSPTQNKPQSISKAPPHTSMPSTSPTQSLPNTGPGDVALIAFLASIGATALHMIWQRVKLSDIAIK